MRPLPAREAELETYFRRRVTQAGGMAVKLAPTEAGVPDRGVLLGGRVHLVELKTSSGALRAVQRVWHAKAEQRGVVVHVLRGRADVDLWLDHISC